ncbi:MAG: hypothetical protein AAGC86_01115 [Pseudomonadota bacterium]
MTRRDGEAAVISITQPGGFDLIRYGAGLKAVALGVVDGAHWNCTDASFSEFEDKNSVQRLAGAAGRSALPENATGRKSCLIGAKVDCIETHSSNVDAASG